jgi:hypothetical protein
VESTVTVAHADPVVRDRVTPALPIIFGNPK